MPPFAVEPTHVLQAMPEVEASTSLITLSLYVSGKGPESSSGAGPGNGFSSPLLLETA